MWRRRNVFEDIERTPLIAIIVAVLCILYSMAFWIEFAHVAQIHTREDAKYADATILSYRESERGGPHTKSMLIACSDGNIYEIRHELYSRYRTLVQAALTKGARVSIYAGPMINDVLELKIYGRTVIPFEEGCKYLSGYRAESAVFAILLDIAGIILAIFGIAKIRHKRSWKLKV